MKEVLVQPYSFLRLKMNDKCEQKIESLMLFCEFSMTSLNHHHIKINLFVCCDFHFKMPFRL